MREEKFRMCIKKDAINNMFMVGNPAVLVRPVAFRLCLATDLAFLQYTT